MSVYKRNGKYYCRFQIDGERHHYLCNGANTKVEAEKIENGFKYKVQQQQNGVIPKEEKHNITFGFLCEKMLEYSKLNKKSFLADKYRINYLLCFIKPNTKVKDIKPIDIETIKNELVKKGKSKTTANRYLEVLSKMFNIALDNEWLKTSPVKRGVKFPIKNYTVRYLTEKEEKKLLKVMPDYFKPIFITALNTGLRRRNLIDLTWKQVDFELGFIEVLENKGNKYIRIKMNDTLYKTLKKLKGTSQSEYCFINPNTNKKYNDLASHWKKIKEDAGVENLRFHDLRHTVGTRLAKANVPINTIKDLLAHSDIHTTMRYIHAATADMEKAIDVLNSYN